MTKRIFNVLLAVIAATLLFSCEKPPVPELKVSPSVANFEASGDLSKTIEVTCNYAWTVKNTADWISLDKTAGEENGSFTLTVTENKSFDVRTATITVESEGLQETISVTQIASVPSLVVSEDITDIPAAGATVQISVTSNVAWTVDVVVDWVTVDKTSGENNGVINVTVQENKSVKGRGVVIGIDCKEHNLGDMIELTQLAAEPALSVSPETVNQVPADGGAVTLEVKANMEWNVTAPEWITLDKTSGDGDATLTLAVAPNLIPDSRSGNVTINGKDTSIAKSIEVSQSGATPSRQTDSLVLAKIYNVADGANWKESRRWDLSKPINEWPGIKLTADGRIKELSITNGTVSTVDWELPAEIAYLTELEIFQAVGSRVKGEFPEYLYGLTKLTKLVLNGNNITGALSDKVSQWTELTNLYVNNNKQFGGTLPAALGSLKKLQNLNIAQTAIGGAVPAELSGCEAMTSFMAYETGFTSIPDNWDKWPALKIIQLYGCTKLECPLPASIGNMKKVTSLQLKNGNFTGNIPESYANLPTTCTQLYINGNKLKGVVPAAVQNHANWKNDKWKVATNILPQQTGYGLTLE